ncbi:helix-turn-helix domain-containing protein [Kurthia gibsonii]|uniref:helix-turn-helix domain-containing protein n=1 Tax=Kurthia gibsonii TaxID=33946 RepID=UPI003019F91A
MDTQELLKQIKNLINVPKEWLSLKEAATYAGVSYNTFIKFREMGLRVAEVEGVKRVSRKEIDTFLENHSY